MDAKHQDDRHPGDAEAAAAVAALAELYGTEEDGE